MDIMSDIIICINRSPLRQYYNMFDDLHIFQLCAINHVCSDYPLVEIEDLVFDFL